jgi:hypothetical protein
MFKKNVELWVTFFIIAIITLVYLQIVRTTEIPAASGFAGHLLGVIGFILMLMTEVLYSLRKRYQFARWGKLQHWLSFHIITGITGPYLVLLHTSWKFNGLAGILMLFTIIIVVSGFIGRYFYTAIPRSAEGTILEFDQITEQIQNIEKQLRDWEISQPEIFFQFQGQEKTQQSGLFTSILNSLQRKKYPEDTDQLSTKTSYELKNLTNRRDKLSKQLANLSQSRRLLAIWHTLHVPLGAAMFLIAIIHIGATLYFATLLH